MIRFDDKMTTYAVIAGGWLWLVLMLAASPPETHGPPKMYGPWPACNSGPVDK